MKLSFRMSILLPVIAAVVVSFAATGLIVYSTSYREIDTIAQQNAWNISYRYGNLVHDEMSNVVNMTELIGSAAESFSGEGEGLEREEVISYLKLVQSTSSNTAAIRVVWEPNMFDGSDSGHMGSAGSTPDGQFAPEIYNDGNTTGLASFLDYATDPRYQMPKQSGKVYISEPTEKTFGSRKVRTMTISRPFNINGRFAGVAGVEVSIDGLVSLIRSIKVYDTGYATLLAQNMVNLSHPQDAQLGKRSAAADALLPYAQKREAHSLERVSLATGLVSLSFFVPVYIEDADYVFYFGTNVTKAEVYGALATVRNIVVIVAALAVLLVVLVIIFIVRGLMKQLGGEPQYVIRKVNDIAKGNFATELDITRNDSSSLVYHIGSMVRQLRETIAHSVEIADNLRNASITLSAGSQELSSGMGEQAQRTEQISSATTEMSATTADIAQNLDHIATFTNETSEKVADGTAAVEEALLEITKIKETADNASSFVSILEGKSAEIRDIIEAITAIADQTNLLALNAAIEAARAGDAGRGFAVVADEVRKLAEKTQQSTSEIAKLVVEIQSEVANVVASMRGVTAQVEHGVSASHSITDVLTEIDRVVATLKDMVDNISGATQEMSATSSQIQQDISEVAVVSDEVRKTTDHLAKNAIDLDNISTVLKEMMERFKI